MHLAEVGWEYRIVPARKVPLRWGTSGVECHLVPSVRPGVSDFTDSTVARAPQGVATQERLIMLSKQRRPCALVAGDPPIMTARRTEVLVIIVSLVLSVHLLGDDHERVLLVLLACVGARAGLSVTGPLVATYDRARGESEAPPGSGDFQLDREGGGETG
jgi:hypothetical protein